MLSDSEIKFRINKILYSENYARFISVYFYEDIKYLK